MNQRRRYDRTGDVILGFVIGTAALVATLFLSEHYRLGKAGTLLAFWLTGIAVIACYFVYLVVQSLARPKRDERRAQPVDGATEGQPFVQWVRTFVLLINLGVAAIVAYVLRQVYSFGIIASGLIGLGTFVVLNGALTSLERFLTRLLRDRRNG